MVEKIIEKVINEMIPHLDDRQLDHLKNVLYVNFHNKELCDQSTELVPRGESGDAAKIRMFIASKKAVNRQDNTLKQYSRAEKSSTCWISWEKGLKISLAWICATTMA